MATHQPTTDLPGFGPAAGWISDLQLSRDDLRRARIWLLGTAILALIAGVLAIAVPAVASVTMSIFVGWILIFAGLVMVSHAFSTRAPIRVTLRLVEGLLTLLVGVYLIAFPLSGTVTLTFVLAVWFFGSGALSLIAAWRLRGMPGAGIAGLNGTLSVILGLLIALDLPSSAAWAIGLLVGINLIFWSLRSMIGAQLLKQLADTRPA
jgi:uncharacterized membrane protein HdeD (DUF308 family)